MHRHLPLALCVLTLGCAPAGDAELRPVLDDEDGYSRALASLDAELEATRARSGTDWTVHGQLAGLHLRRARLAGGYDDYDAALEALDEAFALAPDGSGPHAVEARVLASLHRLPEAEGAVERASERVLLDDATRASLDLLDSELAWQGGAYDDALNGLADVHDRRPTFGSHARIGHQAWHTLDDATAEAAFDDAEEAIVGEAPVLRAWTHLQRGILDLDRGRLDEALDHYHDADAALPGWWLVQEHIAEIWVLTGHEERAEVLYVDIVERTGAPEFMDALAELALSRGEEAEAARWTAEARAAYDDQLARHPEAAAGHAVDHYLTFAAPSEALDLAEANVMARPNAEAHVKLAAAHLAAGDVPAAREALDRALDTPWRNSDLFDVQAAVEAAEAD